MMGTIVIMADVIAVDINMMIIVHAVAKNIIMIIITVRAVAAVVRRESTIWIERKSSYI